MNQKQSKIFYFIIILFLTRISYSQWQSDVRLTYDSAASSFSENAKHIGCSGNFIHVVWRDERIQNGEVFYKRSTDVGLTWSPDIMLTNNIVFTNNPAIAV